MDVIDVDEYLDELVVEADADANAARVALAAEQRANGSNREALQHHDSDGRALQGTGTRGAAMTTVRQRHAAKSAHSDGDCGSDGSMTATPIELPSEQSCKPLQKWSGAEANSLIHLYRGELGRMTLYRVRLDASTNWAVTTTSVLTVLALGTREVPHYFFAFVLYMNTVFLLIEARRTHLVKNSNCRVRKIETGFFSKIVLPQAGYDVAAETLSRVGQQWRIDLAEHLIRPKQRYLTWEALYLRFWRNYVFLYIATYLGWLFKLSIEQRFRWDWAVGVGVGLLAIFLLMRIFRPKTHMISNTVE